jgi:drug/metabolite transporter (DMT)-like permease
MADIPIPKSCDFTVHGIGCLHTGVTAAVALIAFAANSVLCRLALHSAAMDPASFTTVRLVSGAVALILVSTIIRNRHVVRQSGDWISAALLFSYAAAFSFAYVSLSTGVGALILFGSVQTSMLMGGVINGERPHLMVWCGIGVAMLGLVYLVLPGLQAPPPGGAALMAIAGISWAIYSLRGRAIKSPVAATTANFFRSLPFCLVLSLALIPYLDTSSKGVALAMSSGALTSGLGYVIWYTVLRNITTTRAASLQLLVPAIAALGGVMFLSEQITLRLVLSSIMMIGGVGATIVFKARH